MQALTVIIATGDGDKDCLNLGLFLSKIKIKNNHLDSEYLDYSAQIKFIALIMVYVALFGVFYGWTVTEMLKSSCV